MTDTTVERADTTSEAQPPLLAVGIGASAGGIKALKEFFAHVRPESGAAYVVILHLSPDHDSHLAEVLQTTARMPVTQVAAATPIAANHVYVVPPNRSLEIVNGTLIVSEVTRVEQRRSPVDVFFRALADSHGSRAVCVVLSGTGPNGSAGLKRVKEYGGLILVQDPKEAEYADMPRNSIATGLVDLVLPVAQMPGRIASYLEQVRRDDQDVPLAGGDADLEAMREVMTLVRMRTGHDFSNYKSATLQRRIERRMTLRGATSLSQYAKLVRQTPDEAVLLMRELLITVTNFFRDPAAWASLEERIIPRLFDNKSISDHVRVWVTGCATGEEAYSLAMLLAEHAAAAAVPPAIQVFATDLDERAISVARDGLYSNVDVADVSEERLRRFFHRETDGFRIRREIREMVLFAHHNLLKDPPFSHLDLISCRNLLIYLNRAIQERVVETFHFALKPGGYLFLGASESPDGTNDRFLRLDAAAHVYESRPVSSQAMPVSEINVSLPRPLTRAPEPRAQDKLSPSELHQRLLEEYASPSIVVTEDGNIVHLSARAGRFLEMRGGEPSRDLLTLIKAELRPDLRTALHQAARDRTNVDVRNVVVPLEDGNRRVTISVRPVLRDGDPARGFLLVLLTETTSPNPVEPSVQLTSPAEPFTVQLENDLTRVRLQLRQTVEQYETQVEEAKAANEELQAMNEELRSAAEELETGKEELQSVNEELTTVNQELKIKIRIDELAVTNNDFQNLMNATDIGTIFVDRSLRVRFSTPRARAIFNLLETDVGRRLTDITSRLRYDGIFRDVQSVLDHLQSIEREVESDDRRWHLARLLPYRTSDNRIDGIVLTFQDITERRASELRVRESEERLRLLIDSTLDYAIYTMTEAGAIDSWNSGAARMYGYTADEIIGKSALVLFTPEDRAAGALVYELDAARHEGRSEDERYQLRKDGSRLYCSGITRRLGSGGLGFAKIARDLTAPRTAAAALLGAHEELEGRVRSRTAELELEVKGQEAAKESVTNLLRRIVSAQEDERSRIARDLHDHLGQQLTALRLALERHQTRGGPATDDDVNEALSLTSQIGKDVDFLAWELRPAALDELGLGAALPRFLTEWSAHTGIPAEFRLRGFEPGQLRPEAELAFYRIMQEALNNVAKHAHASRVDIVLAQADHTVVLVVEDDGVGFDDDDSAMLRGVGLAGMRERAALVGANVQLESTPGKGTSVFVRCPIATAG